jgi:hypothetical protein
MGKARVLFNWHIVLVSSDEKVLEIVCTTNEHILHY